MAQIPPRVLAILLGATALVAVTVWAVLGLRPPPHLTMAAGPADGAYYRVASRYKSRLAEDGITVEILTTEGSRDNLDLLASGVADAAILQGGIAAGDRPVAAIGKIFNEPVLFLARAGLGIDPNPAHWHDLTINRGREGSGSSAAFDAFSQAVGLPAEANRLTELGYGDAVQALTDGRIDVAVFVAPLTAPYLIAAYAQPGIAFLDIAYADAISRRWPAAGLVKVPAGAISLDPVEPEEPHILLALQALLTVRDDLHPALVNRLTMAALDLHADPGILNERDEFPAPSDLGFPMNSLARQIIINGPTAWHDRLPYWIAAQINRVFVLVLPLLFLLIPLMRALPAAYAYAMNLRVWKHYPAMCAIENRLAESTDPAALTRMEKELTALDEKIASLRLPPPYRQTAYHARMHIDLLQKHIAERQSAPEARN
ncbi:MAG: TAXI family TRAP transporter solute-binding subunit [Marinibacterium sp.]